MFSYSLGVWGTSEKVYENLPFLTSSRIPQRTGCRKQTAAVTGSDPHSKSPPCCCVADAAPLGRSHIWVFLGLPQCPALKSHLCLGSSPQSGGPWTTPLQPPFLWLSPIIIFFTFLFLLSFIPSFPIQCMKTYPLLFFKFFSKLPAFRKVLIYPD